VGDDATSRLLALRSLPKRRVIGLQSGTSADGVDAALIEIEGCGQDTRARLIAFAAYDFGDGLGERLQDPLALTAGELCALDFLLGEAFAQAALALVRAAGLSREDVHLVGSHGQTICHQPPSAGGRGATLQIGEAAVIAERTGLPVISDFRVRDMAAGGEGAPLVPLADYYLFRARGRVRALQNLGGIANVTVVPDNLAGVFAFDNGPGNMALDAVVRAASAGREPFDRDGVRAARGRIDAELLEELHRLPFFALEPPRSTGREEFGAALVAPLCRRFADRLDDLLATLTRFTAEAVRRSYAAHVDPRARIEEVFVSGGGVHNKTLMRHLEELFAPVPVRSTAEEGIDPDAKEAMAFAILANEALFGMPGNVPAATGARGPRVLGKLVPA
jgi:anhydro-N-acetylmuramic acid kinase